MHACQPRLQLPLLVHLSVDMQLHTWAEQATAGKPESSCHLLQLRPSLLPMHVPLPAWRVSCSRQHGAPNDLLGSSKPSETSTDTPAS